MKTKIYILTAIMISGILFSSIPFKPLNAQECITIRCIDNNADAKLLEESANIIENRLKTVGIKTTKVNITGDQSTIEICFANKNELLKIDDLLTASGIFEFYETLDKKDFVKHIKKDDKLFSILNNDESSKELSPVLGFCNENMKAEADKYLKSLKSMTDENMTFMWSKYKDKENNVFLYLLKNEASLKGNHISKVRSNLDKSYGHHEILINLDETGAKKFQEITRENIGKIVAIVLDNEVYSAPMVVSEISGGKLMISGDFTADETDFLVALIKNGELPLEFEIVR